MEHFLSLWPLQQNQDRKHRTYVYVLTVTETLEAWEDSVNIGRVSPPPHLTSSGTLNRCHDVHPHCWQVGHLLNYTRCCYLRAGGPYRWRGLQWQQVPINLGHQSWLQPATVLAGTCSVISCPINAITPCRYVFKYERDAGQTPSTCIAGKSTCLVRSLWCKMCCLRVAPLLVVFFFYCNSVCKASWGVVIFDLGPDT